MSLRGASLGCWPPALLLSLSPALALAQSPPPPAQRGLVYSAYEEETIREVLTALGRSVDPSPEGKTIERVDVVPLNVIEPRDPLPLWVNWLHATSRPSIIQRELLVREGEPYRQVLVDETIRNLRRLPQLSAILVVATAGTAPDRVGLVIITKDVWSLRLNWDITLTGGGLELFEALPAEWNFLGTHQTLSGHFVYQPLSLTFGAAYTAPRLGESRVALDSQANIVVNRFTGTPEGSFGSLVTGEPLYSGLVPWSWDAQVSWVDFINRQYSNAQEIRIRDRATGEVVPDEWRVRQYFAQFELTRSLGWETKHDFTFAAGVNRLEYRTDFPGVSQKTIDDFRAFTVPVSDTRVGPAIQYHTYTKRFVRVIDFDTLALQEDFRLGHDVVLRAYPSFRGFGASRDVLGLSAAAEYTFGIWDGLFRVSLASITEPELGPTSRIADASLQPTAHLVSPSIAGLGRLVLDATFLYRWRNYLNAQTFLGGDDRLRGYPTNAFLGQNFVSYNVEFRSRPIEILSCQLGAVAFFDAGDAFQGASDFRILQSVGVGLRALFPQLDRLVFRADLGVPIEQGARDVTGSVIPPFGYVISFEQAFDTPSVSPTPVLPTGQQ